MKLTIEAMKQAVLVCIEMKRFGDSGAFVLAGRTQVLLESAITREEAQSVEPYGWLILSRYQGQSVTRDICIGLEEFTHRAKYLSEYEYMGDDGIPKYKDGTDAELGWNSWCSKPIFVHPIPAPTGERAAMIADAALSTTSQGTFDCPICGVSKPHSHTTGCRRMHEEFREHGAAFEAVVDSRIQSGAIRGKSKCGLPAQLWAEREAWGANGQQRYALDWMQELWDLYLAGVSSPRVVLAADSHNQESHGWMMQGSNQVFKGEFAELDAKSEAKRCGGTCYAYPIYTNP